MPNDAYSSLPERLLRKFAFDRNETVKAACLFGYLFFVTSASTVGRTAADTLFLSKYSSSALSFMYLPQSVVLLLTGLLFQRLSARIRLDRLVSAIVVAAAVISFALRLLVGFGAGAVVPVYYVVCDVLNFLMIVSFWQLATAVMDQRKAKRMIGIVGSGGIVGGIVSGFGLKGLAHTLGTENLMFVYTALQLFCLPLVLLLIRRTSDAAAAFAASGRGRDKRKGAAAGADSGLFRNVPHLPYVALMAASLTIALMLIDFQFKSILRSSMQNEALAGFMGSFYGVAGLVALAVQLFVSGRLISRFGVMTALLMFPVALFAGSFALLLYPVLWIAVAVKGTDKAVGDTIYSSVNQLIMFPVAPEWRSRAKSFLDGVVRNGAKGIAAIALIGLSRLMTPYELSYVILALMIVGIAAAIKIKGAYLKTLLSSLRKQNIDVQDAEIDFMDSVSRRVLADALHSQGKTEALFALRVVQEMDDFELNPHLPRLLAHAELDVRVETLRAIERRRPEDGVTLALPLLDAPEPQLRAQAYLTLAAYASEAWFDRIAAGLDAPEAEVRAGAVGGLIKYYGIEGMFLAVGPLKTMLASPRDEERTIVARLFGVIGIPSFYKPLVPMLADPSPDVRLRALESAALLRVPELVPVVVPLLASGETREQALAALTAYDERVVLPMLLPYLADKDPIVQLPRVWEQFETSYAFDAMFGEYERATPELREKMLDSLVLMNRKLGLRVTDRTEALVAQELAAYWRYDAQAQALNGFEAWRELTDAVRQLQAKTAARVFGLLSLQYEPATMQNVYANWTEGDARQQANAAEVVDQLLEGEQRAGLIRLMAPRQQAAATADREEADRVLEALFLEGDWWVRSLIRLSAADAGGRQPAAWPLVARLLERPELALAEEIDAERLERIRLLRNVGLFRGLSGKDLAAIAHRLQDEQAQAGSAIIREGETGASLYVIRSGRAGVYRGSDKLGSLASGDCFGEMAILMQGPRTATVTAEEASSLFRLDSSAFFDMMFDRTGIALEMMKLLSRRLRAAIEIDNQRPKAQPAAGAAAEAQAGAREAAAALASETAEQAGAPIEAQSGNAALLRLVLALQRIGLFARFSRDDFVRLASMVEEVVVRPGEAICREGEEGDAMYVIVEGGVRVHRGARTLAQLGSGDSFGEMAVIDGTPRSADCTASERTVLLKLTRLQVTAFCFQRKEVLRSMLRMLAERLKTMQERGA
ncbi:Npt1/Npt2 family nucleotide transporter [Paenibacillus cymbidii]|uniref:Npt1/Npt2 family nucleotide transporter n=1 Tax=Paenibacillus cymbidii TaxID=1639034 RepID=UPI001081942A|nr:Npt1/Npt2 family nucleotide transporter [Paenibacillus cymbidii]